MTAKSCMGYFYEILGLQILLPFSEFTIENGITWYISVMIVCQFFIVWMYKKKKDFYLYLFIPISLFLFLSLCITELGCLDATVHWYLIPGFSKWGFNLGLIRGLVEMSLGVFLYEAHVKLKSPIENKRTINLLNTLELVLFVGSFLYMVNLRGSYLDFILIFVLAILILVSFLGDGGYLKQITDNPCVRWLGKISYLMYLTQFYAIWKTGIIFGRLNIPWQMNIIVCSGILVHSILISSIIQLCIDGIQKRISIKQSKSLKKEKIAWKVEASIK